MHPALRKGPFFTTHPHFPLFLTKTHTPPFHFLLTGLCSVVILLSKRWWIPIGARLEGPKLESERPRAEMGFPTADQRFSCIRCTLFGFYGI